MTLKLKKEYEGLRITKNNFIFGKITFDSYTVQPEHYINYYNRGFEDMFDVIEDEPQPQLLVEDKPKRKPRK